MALCAADHLTTDFNLLIATGGQDACALSRRCNLQCTAQPCSPACNTVAAAAQRSKRPCDSRLDLRRSLAQHSAVSADQGGMAWAGHCTQVSRGLVGQNEDVPRRRRRCARLGRRPAVPPRRWQQRATQAMPAWCIQLRRARRARYRRCDAARPQAAALIWAVASRLCRALVSHATVSALLHRCALQAIILAEGCAVVHSQRLHPARPRNERQLVPVVRKLQLLLVGD